MAKRCLVVDDDSSNLLLLRTVLARSGFEVLEARNASEAIAATQQDPAGIDLVVCDLRMPGEMDGLQLAHFVQNSFPAIRVLLISAYVGDRNLEGIHFLSKPFTGTTLVAAVNRILNAST